MTSRFLRWIRLGRLRATAGTRRRRVSQHATIEPLESGRGFRLGGSLDLDSYDACRRAIEPELQGTLILDLSAVEFVDDGGFGFLFWAYKRLRDEGGSLTLRYPSSEVLRVFEMTGLARLPGLTIEREREES